MRLILIIIIGVCAVWDMNAQSQFALIEQIRMNDQKYLFGEGYGQTYSEADNNALVNLISKIATSLSSSFEKVVDEVNTTTEGLTHTSAVRMVMNSYSQATLTNTKSININDADDYHVMRYISKDDLEEVFRHREEKIGDMIRCAQRAEKLLKIDDALRYYYWGYTLMRSMQYPSKLRYDDNGTSRLLSQWIPEQMNNIFSNLQVKVAEVKGNDAILYFTYNGMPVNSLDFSFYNGNGWTMLNSAKDGVAAIEFRDGVDVASLKIQYEYEYAGEAQIDSEIDSVIKIFKGQIFPKSQVVLLNKQKSVKSNLDNSDKLKYEATINSNIEGNIEMLSSHKEYEKSIQSIIKAIKNKSYIGIKHLFTPEGWNMTDKLLHYGNAKLLADQKFSFFRLSDGKVCCRSLRMTFSFPNNHKTFTEDVTFTFDCDKRIESIAFSLGREAKDGIIDKDIWSESSRMSIVTFLENYKTAFALKRLDYIESIFDDNAVIITGHVAKRKKANNQQDGLYKFQSSEVVTYNRYTKQQYIEKLRKIFANNQFVNIHFANNYVCKMPGAGECYGIQIHQDYYSSTYGDTGYLFLMLNLNNPKEPSILVRTWQPERDPNYNIVPLPRNHPDYGIVSPANF